MYSKTRRAQAPAKAFDHSIVTVLFQVAAIKMWILLFLGMFVLAGAAQMLRFLRPGEEGWDNRSLCAILCEEPLTIGLKNPI